MKSAEEMVQIIQKEEQELWKLYKKVMDEEPCRHPAMENHLREQHAAILNLMDDLEIERLK